MDDNAWYLIAKKEDDGKLLGFAHFRYDMDFDDEVLYVYEIQRTVVARRRPLVVITSNNEKELPDAFLRRCFFHYIKFPDAETMQQIVDVHYYRDLYSVEPLLVENTRVV